MNPQSDFREQRGEAIAREFGQVRRVNDFSYKVHSQTRDVEYDVRSGELGWICSCPDFAFRGSKCKHVWAVEISWTLRQRVRQEVVIEEVTVEECRFCRSQNLKKFGVRKNKCGGIQRFLCADCRRTFSINLGFEKMKHNPQAVTSAMQLYFNGESLRNVADSLRLIGGQVSHQTVYNWIRKYVALMQDYTAKITPQVGDTWRADELFVKFRGDMKYVFALMDDETRFWIAKQVTDDKFTADVRPLFAEGKKVAGKKPTTLITDGGMHFVKPFKNEFYTAKYPRTTHIRDIRFDGSVHNNKMERINGEIRDREKVMRGLKRTDTPILTGYQLFHNYVRPHEGLKGETPANKAGIKVEGHDKWKTLIQNATLTLRVRGKTYRA